MKNLISLTELNRKQLNEIFDVASQMRRIVKANFKRGPQLSGSMVAGLWEKPCISGTAFALATSYLSGSFCPVFGADDLETQCKMLNNMGANALIVSCANDNLARNMANSCSCSIINGGSSHYDPIGVLADLMALSSKSDGLQNLSVLLVGNKRVNKVNELVHCLQLYGSTLVWYLPTDDFVTQRKGIVMDKAEAAFMGADAVVDLGLAEFSDPQKYYGSRSGIAEKLLEKARINCPILGTKSVVDNIGVKDYAYSLADLRDECYVSVAMAVLYLLHRN